VANWSASAVRSPLLNHNSIPSSFNEAGTSGCAWYGYAASQATFSWSMIVPSAIRVSERLSIGDWPCWPVGSNGTRSIGSTGWSVSDAAVTSVGGCVGEAGVWVPVAFLTDAQAATYGCYSHRRSPAELDRSMHIRTVAHGTKSEPDGLYRRLSDTCWSRPGDLAAMPSRHVDLACPSEGTCCEEQSWVVADR